MINQRFRLVSVRQFSVDFVDEQITEETIVVRPTFLSICAADQRYYTGTRGKEVLDKKLPMSLIHEAVGEVVFDPKGEIASGTRVILIPNTPINNDKFISENYLKSTLFRSSSMDGFMQNQVFMQRDRLIEVPKNMDSRIASFTELISVAVHAINRFEMKSNNDYQSFGVWGDGNLGFLISLILTEKYPNSKVYVFGKNKDKLDYFSFVHSTINISEVPEELQLSHCFECVGSRGSEDAVSQIIKHIKPEGSISLLGVSEHPIKINSRLILEKGITLFGSSRSGKQDYLDTISILQENDNILNYLANLIGEVIEVKTITDLGNAFETDLINVWGKTIMKWNM